MYLLDLRTGEQRKIPNYPLFGNKGRIVFLDPNLVWVKPNYILDLTDGQSYELLDLRQYCCDNNKCCDNNGLNPVIYSYIQAADRVFIDPSGDKLIALSTDFRTNQNGRVVLGGHITDDGEFLLELVKSLGMDYENVDSQ